MSNKYAVEIEKKNIYIYGKNIHIFLYNKCYELVI